MIRTLMTSPHPTRKMVGRRISRIRELRGLTQTDLARKMGSTQKSVSSWETGRSKIGLLDLVRLCNVLEVSADVLLCRVDVEGEMRVRQDPLIFVSREDLARLEHAEHVDEVADMLNVGFVWHIEVPPDAELVSQEEAQGMRARAAKAIDGLRGFTSSWLARQVERIRKEES